MSTVSLRYCVPEVAIHSDIMARDGSDIFGLPKSAAAVSMRSKPVVGTSEKTVAILLCTYRGEKFLHEQLASIEAQSHTDWRLFVSDDGSDDDTLEIIREFSARFPGRVDLRTGPKLGDPALNFLSLACDTSIDADYFAFCDQDDVWMPQKLQRALEVLDSGYTNTPTAYGGRTLLVNEHGVPYGRSPLFSKSPTFRNALVQSIAGGNTIVFNRATRDLLAAASLARPVSHDWWTYQLVTGAGGQFYYDSEPAIAYRQHGKNQVGANIGWQARVHRVKMTLNGRFGDWRRQNIRALKRYEHLLTLEARNTLSHFERLEESSLVARVRNLSKSGVYRQTLGGELGLIVATMLRCV